MARLIVKSKGKVLEEISMEPGTEYLAGRGEGAQIRLPSEKGISREHFKLIQEEGVWKLIVVSRYGKVYSDSGEVESCVLENGQKFRVPPYEFEIRTLDQSLVAMGASSPPADQGAQVDLDEKTFVQHQKLNCLLKVIDSLGQTREVFRLEGAGPWIAGREGEIPIIISDARVSRRQFEIFLKENQYFIQDLGSSNGTLLNNQNVSSVEPVPLQSGDQIRVLSTEMTFEVRDPRFDKLAQSTDLVALAQHLPVQALGTLPVPLQGHYPTPHGSQFPQPMAGGASFEQPETFPQAISIPLPVPRNFVEKFQALNTKQKVIYVFIGIALGLVFIFGDWGGGDKTNSTEKPKTPFEMLSVEKQREVKGLYPLMKNFKLQGKFQNCIDVGGKILEVLPAGYEDVGETIKNCQQAKEDHEAELREIERLKALEAQEKEIQEVCLQCEKLFNENTLLTEDELNSCLSKAILLDATHPRIDALNQRMTARLQEKKFKEEQQRAYQESVSKLQALFAKAQASEKREPSPLDIIPEYQKVVDSSLPDPNGLKVRSRRKIQELSQSLSTQTSTLIHEAEQARSNGNMRVAIQALGKALRVDPFNQTIKDMLSKYITENRQKLRPLYEESVIEEKYGNVASAVERWKKILENDVPEGEYYRKAYKKLKDYGELIK